MDRETEDRVIDLGVASLETQGSTGDSSDEILFEQVAGLTAD